MALITTETARQMAARSAESRRLNPLRAVPPGYKLVPADYPEHVPASDDYPAVILARTRTQLDLVGRQITAELEREKPDSRRLRDLTDAQTRLAEQVHALEADRSRLAADLDAELAHARRLETASQDVARRLDVAMENIAMVLDTQDQ